MQLPYPVRSLGQRVLGPIPLRVRSGVNRGRLWSAASAGRGYLSGAFGRDRLQVLELLARVGECFWDLGAHKGFMSLAASRLVGPSGRVVAVEPASSNLTFLRRHLRWNDALNVVVVPAAVGRARSRRLFGGRGDSLAYRLGRGDEEVEVDTLPGLARTHGLPPPSMLKIDVEGREAVTLEGARDFLSPEAALLVSVHDRELHRACTTTLEALGFRVFESRAMQEALSSPDRGWGGDHDLVAIGPDRAYDEGRLARCGLIAG